MAEKRDSYKAGRITWLAEEIFKAFPRECTGLKMYTMDCGSLNLS